MESDRSRLSRIGIVVLPLAAIAVFVAWPLVRILERGLRAEAITELARSGRTRSIIGFTVVQAVISTMGALLLAIPAAWLIGTHRFRGRRVLSALWTVPFTLPTIVVGLTTRQMFPPRWQHGLAAITCAHIFFNVGFSARTIGAAWTRLDRRPEEAAATLGASPLSVFRYITLPRLTGAIASVAGVVLALCLTSFGVVLLLATPTQSTVEVEIWRQTTQLLRLDRAGALAILQLVLVSAALLFTARIGSRVSGTRADNRQRTLDTRKPVQHRTTAVLIATIMSVITLGPLVALAIRSLRTTGGGWGVDGYRALAHVTRGSGLTIAPIHAIKTSIIMAVPAALMATALGAMAAIAVVRRIGGMWVSAFVSLPIAVSAVTLGFGFLIAFDRSPIAWRSSWWIVPIVQSVTAMPFVQRLLTPAFARLDPRLREVAATLGASPRQVLRRVTLPMVARPMLASFGVATAIALGEFGATTFLVRPDTTTIPIAIARLAARPGAQLRTQSFALAVILGALTMSITLLCDFAIRERD